RCGRRRRTRPSWPASGTRRCQPGRRPTRPAPSARRRPAQRPRRRAPALLRRRAPSEIEPVLERGKLATHVVNALAPELGDDDAFALFAPTCDDFAPRIDDEAVAESAPAVLVRAAL